MMKAILLKTAGITDAMISAADCSRCFGNDGCIFSDALVPTVYIAIHASATDFAAFVPRIPDCLFD